MERAPIGRSRGLLGCSSLPGALEKDIYVIVRVLRIQPMEAVLLNEVDDGWPKVWWFAINLREDNRSLCIFCSWSVEVSMSAWLPFLQLFQLLLHGECFLLCDHSLLVVVGHGGRSGFVFFVKERVDVNWTSLTTPQVVISNRW